MQRVMLEARLPCPRTMVYQVLRCFFQHGAPRSWNATGPALP